MGWGIHSEVIFTTSFLCLRQSSSSYMVNRNLHVRQEISIDGVILLPVSIQTSKYSSSKNLSMSLQHMGRVYVEVYR